jgi:plastocyanin
MKLAAALVALAFASQHGHAGPPAEILLRLAEVSPARMVVLTGEKVTWRNVSIRQHTVTSAAGGFDSGVIPTDDTYSHEFPAPGDFSYFCKLHPSVKGVIVVRDVVLEGPPTVVRGEHFTLTGRGTPADPTLLRNGVPAGTVTPTAGGFSAEAVGDETAEWAVAGADPVRVEVIERRVLELSRRGGSLHLTVAPAAPGATVVLQQRRKERFGWWPLRRARLDADSSATFKAPRRRAPTRVVLTQADGATVLATSNSLRPTRSR